MNPGTPTVSDTVDATLTVANNAPATFPVGTTPVTWTAVHDANNQARCTRQVTVLGTPGGNTITITAPDPFANEAGLTPGRFRVTRASSTTNVLAVFFTVGGNATPEPSDPSSVKKGASVLYFTKLTDSRFVH